MMRDTSNLLLLAVSEKRGMLPVTILLWRNVLSKSGPTPLKATPRKSSSVLMMPCFTA